MKSLRRCAAEWLLCRDPDAKATGVRALDVEGVVDVDELIDLAYASASIPGRPVRPVLVAHAQLARRSVNTLEGRAALLHALAHIEFNAINLALDAAWRYAG
ncbi:MAG TPA: DUF455 family protein, partial [Burkholderiaceae bacterium]|nr:DUF455 family protein [Burkholderiaceae bacterium]